MNATGACPRVVLSEGGVQFGKCTIGEKLEKTVTIKNVSNFDVFINSPNLSHFHAHPSKFRLAKDEEKEILVRFKPKNLGKIDIKSQFILNKNYPLLFRMVGHGITKPRNIHLKNKGKPFKLVQSEVISRDGLVQSSTNLKTTGKLKLPKLASQSIAKIDYLRESRKQRKTQDSRLRSKK